MFGGLVAFAIYRILYLGLVWVEYDMENANSVIPHPEVKPGCESKSVYFGRSGGHVLEAYEIIEAFKSHLEWSRKVDW